MIGQTISHYLILSQLGGGGMGVVCDTEDLKQPRHVAMNRFEELMQRVSSGKK